MITKVMKFEISHPVNIKWDLFGKILSQLQYDSHVLMNKTLQMLWDFQMLSFQYKEQHGKYLAIKDLPNKYSSITGDIGNTLKEDFKRMPSGTYDCSIREAEKKWKHHKSDILKGNKNMISFQRDCPIGIRDRQILIDKYGNKYQATLSLVGKEWKKELGMKTGKIEVVLKAVDGTQKAILQRVMSGEYKLSQSELVKKGKKWFLHLCYSFEQKNKTFDESNVMGVDMGIVYPAYMAFSHNLKRYRIDGGEIEEFRRKVEKRRISMLNQGKYCGQGRIGHGIKTRIKPIMKMSDKVSNFRNSCNHKYSRYIVDMALRHEVGLIQLEDLSGINKDSVFLKKWSYYDLQQKIKYKAEEHGIKVIFVEPAYTSQRCSKCGCIDKSNRPEQKVFHCTSCGFETNADYNAAKNLAVRDIDKIIAEEMKEKKKVA